MPFNGSGVFNRIYSWVTDAANGVDVSSSRTDTDTNDIATGLSNCITRDGQSPATANIPMGGFKITGLATGTVSTDAVNLGQLQSITLVASTAPALVNSWANVSSQTPAGYFKDPFGVVHLEGSINGGASASTAFTLPSGYRPPGGNVWYPVVDVARDGTTGFIVIGTDGTVAIAWAGVAPTIQVPLDGITFRTT